jgi:hypothetical protein
MKLELALPPNDLTPPQLPEDNQQAGTEAKRIFLPENPDRKPKI